MKVALYLRVSTARQAEKDLSIPDQRNRLEAWCRDKGWTVAAEYVEPGASATDDKRPQFQRMMDDATRKDRPFDAVLVHSFSRFFRDAFYFELHRRSLEKNNVALISITQAVADDGTGQMIRQIYAIFDEQQSRENAKHVSRAMEANARAGFWNGSRAPFGYKTITVEIRGDAHKKKLAIDPPNAEIVLQIFSAYMDGAGIRTIAHDLNERGLTMRGTAFSANRVHEILTRETYAGTHYYNRKDWRKGKQREPAKWVPYETPVIIEPHTWRDVQRRLRSRRATRVAPRVLNGPVLLTGLAKCATCGGGLTLVTGKSGKYRYYGCHSAMYKGKTKCKGRNIPMAALDDIVVGELEQRIFSPMRLEALLEALVAKSREKNEKHAERARELRRALKIIEDKIERSLAALSEGLVNDTDLFKKHNAALEAEREETLHLIAALEHQRSLPKKMVSPENLARFSTLVKGRLRDPDQRLRKGYVRQFIDMVEVGDDLITIRGSRAALAGSLRRESGGGGGQDSNDNSGGGGGVPGVVPEWWTWRDSNPRPRD